jgi:hypothetical protein
VRAFGLAEKNPIRCAAPQAGGGLSETAAVAEKFWGSSRPLRPSSYTFAPLAWRGSRLIRWICSSTTLYWSVRSRCLDTELQAGHPPDSPRLETISPRHGYVDGVFEPVAPGFVKRTSPTSGSRRISTPGLAPRPMSRSFGASSGFCSGLPEFALNASGRDLFWVVALRRMTARRGLNFYLGLAPHIDRFGQRREAR